MPRAPGRAPPTRARDQGESAEIAREARLSPPGTVVATIHDPMGRKLARSLLVAALLAAALVGCNLQQSYVTPDGQTVVQLAMPADTAPIAMSRDSALFSVETDVFLPVRQPTDAEMSALWSSPPVPFERMPWAQRGDYALEITLVITNVDTQRIATTATLNGINEFNRYLPAFTVDDNTIIPDFSQWERTYSLAPGERRVVTIREEELDEVATDLASVVNTSVTFGPPDPMTMMAPTCSDVANEIVYFMNQSTLDARSRMCVPAVVPALVGFVLGLRAEGDPGSMAPAVAIEASVRLRDLRSRLSLTGTPWDVENLGQVSFTPPVALP